MGTPLTLLFWRSIFLVCLYFSNTVPAFIWLLCYREANTKHGHNLFITGDPTGPKTTFYCSVILEVLNINCLHALTMHVDLTLLTVGKLIDIPCS